MAKNNITGALLGLALADALGAPFEGGPIERFVWGLIGKSGGRRRYTDDTAMALDVAESLAEKREVDQDDLAQRFASSYKWSRGYGPGAAKVLKRIAGGMTWQESATSVYPTGSFGNGGAMRSPIVGAYFGAQGPDAVAEAAARVAEITHAHLLGIQGAQIVAIAAGIAATSETGWVDPLRDRQWDSQFSSRLERAHRWLSHGESPGPDAVATHLGNGILATESAVTAVYLAERFRASPFEDLLAFCRDLGGDVDTIGAMSGGIWGAHRGSAELPPRMILELEAADQIIDAARRLAATA